MRLLPFMFIGLATLAFGAGCDDVSCSLPTRCANPPDGSGGGGGVGGGGASPTGNLAATVAHYDYAFDVITAQGRSKLTLDVTPPGGDCWQVSSELGTLTDVTWNGAPASITQLGMGVLGACGGGVGASNPLEIGALVPEVPEKTWFGLDVGFSRKKNSAGGTFSYLLSWVGGCDRFGPCDDDPSRIASYHFDVTHPEGTVVLCPGTLSAGATRTSCDLTGAPTYSAFAIAADPFWKRSPFGTFAGVDIVFYEGPSGALQSSLDPASVGAFMDWITARLGPFPYGNELRVAGAPTAWLGFEHPANIILNEQLGKAAPGNPNGLFHVFMHEVVHQWAGDRTTLASAQDFVWKEATAEYLSYVFEDEARPPEEAAATRKYWDSISLQAQHWPRPMDEPSVEELYGDVYGPGPMVLYLQLEPFVGRQALLEGIASFLSKPGGRSVLELRDALEVASGKNLVDYFDAWVFGYEKPVWPTFDVQTSQVGGEVTVTVTQSSDFGKLFGCVVEVELKGATQSTRALVDFGLTASGVTATATVPFAEPVVSTVLDPDHRLIGWKAGALPIVEKQKVWIY
jgi:aminopeptidase N